MIPAQRSQRAGRDKACSATGLEGAQAHEAIVQARPQGTPYSVVGI